jgi:hypothetical protein
MRNDTLENWRKHNPVLMKGEVGCAIDDARGVVIYKVGDGVHKWTELSLVPGEAERTSIMEAAQINMVETLEKIATTAEKVGISTQEMISALSEISKNIREDLDPVTVGSALKIISERMKYHQEKTTKSNLNPYLEDFEIPHYDFEDVDMKNLIDF